MYRVWDWSLREEGSRVPSDVVSPGDVLLIALPSHTPRGHEQQGVRPAVVVGVPKGAVRYPVVIVVPLTTQTGDWAERNPVLYPRLPWRRAGGLRQPSTALVDQVRSIDVRRVTAYLGGLDPNAFQAVRHGLMQLFQDLQGEPL